MRSKFLLLPGSNGSVSRDLNKMSCNKIINEQERMQLCHLSVNKNEVQKRTKQTLREREIISKLTVQKRPTCLEILLRT